MYFERHNFAVGNTSAAVGKTVVPVVLSLAAISCPCYSPYGRGGSF